MCVRACVRACVHELRTVYTEKIMFYALYKYFYYLYDYVYYDVVFKCSAYLSCAHFATVYKYALNIAQVLSLTSFPHCTTVHTAF